MNPSRFQTVVANFYGLIKRLLQMLAYAKPYLHRFYGRWSLNFKRGAIIKFVGFSLVIALIVFLLFYFSHRNPSVPAVVNATQAVITATPLNPAPSVHTQALQAQWRHWHRQSQQQQAKLKRQLKAIQQALQALLAQQAAVQQAQHVARPPNPTVLQHLAHLQMTMQKMAKQATQKKWIKPKQVERYFQLVAVQGFSDGLRAILDIAGHTVALRKNEACPACRGWVLQRMNFPQQRAVFAKRTGQDRQWVQLQAN